MKRNCGGGIAVLALLVHAQADPLRLDLPSRGPHHRIVTTSAGGYVAVANGIHYFADGQWHESDPAIDLAQSGAVALRLPHKLAFPQNLSAGVDILTPEGFHLRAIPRAIAYFDALDGRTALLGVLKNPPAFAAELHPPNVLVYPDAFDGVRAGVRYVVDRGSLIQCVVFAENLPDPAVFGMNRDTVRIEVWNAFGDAPPPQQSQTLVRAEADPVLRAVMAEPDLTDTTVAWGEFHAIPGKSFLLSELNGNPAPGGDIPGAVPVFKRWIETEQGAWLVEAVEFSAVEARLARLPASSFILDANSAGQLIADDRVFPETEPAQPVNLPIRVVNGANGQDGFCIDYTLVYSASSWTFQSGVTYLVDGSFSISSSTTFQTNAVVKYRRNAVLTLSGTVTTPSSGPPAILTSFDDFTAGELLPGGTPVGYIGTTALSLYNVNYYGAYIENLEVRQFKTAFSYYSPSGSHIIRNCRLHVCQIGLNAYYTTVTLSNLVSCAVATLYTNSGSSSISTAAISTDCQRTAAGWGYNQFGQALPPNDLTNVIAVSAGGSHSLALRSDGIVLAWGANQFRQCNVPSGLTNVIAIAAGGDHSMALKSDGKVVAWGDNSNGQTNVPASLGNVVAIAAGCYHSVALKADGTVASWSSIRFGLTNLPVTATNVVAVAAQLDSSFALRRDGTLVAWGRNDSGQLDFPATLANVSAVAPGNFHGIAVTNGGMIAGWGSNAFGESSPPTGLSNVISVSAGYLYSLALKRDGTLVSWGLISNVQAGVTGVVAISAGSQHSLAVRAGAATPVITSATTNR